MMANRPMRRDSIPRAEGAPDIILCLIASELMIRATLLRLRHGLQRAGAAPDLVERAELLLAEILNNIAEHAYGGTTPGRIELRCALGPAGLVITVRDWGRPLPHALLRPPCTADPPQPTCAVDSLPEGGFGWSIIHQMAQKLRAYREVDCNQLQCYLPQHDASLPPDRAVKYRGNAAIRPE